MIHINTETRKYFVRGVICGLLFLLVIADSGLASVFQSPAQSFFVAQTASVPDCGEPVMDTRNFDTISTYALIAAVLFFIAGVLLDKKPVKYGLWGLAIVPCAVWGYINFAVDYASIKKTVFTYNVQAEAALANIAEGQERYKGEHGFYLKDLNKLYSHLAGAQGVDQCIRILDLTVGPNGWTATAQHINSPDKIFWDGASGSSLKKG